MEHAGERNLDALFVYDQTIGVAIPGDQTSVHEQDHAIRDDGHVKLTVVDYMSPCPFPGTVINLVRFIVHVQSSDVGGIENSKIGRVDIGGYYHMGSSVIESGKFWIEVVRSGDQSTIEHGKLVLRNHAGVY